MEVNNTDTHHGNFKLIVVVWNLTRASANYVDINHGGELWILLHQAPNNNNNNTISSKHRLQYVTYISKTGFSYQLITNIIYLSDTQTPPPPFGGHCHLHLLKMWLASLVDTRPEEKVDILSFYKEIKIYDNNFHNT